MKPLLNFDDFSLVESLNRDFSLDLDVMFESLAAAVGNPIKYTKIKNNAKKYQKALVTKALADVEYEKKKKKGLEPKQKEVLVAATKAKKQAMDDLASAVSQRMDDLATTEPLKNVAKLAKTKAKISAAETSLKSADKTETAELEDKISKMKTTSSNIEQELKKVEKESKNKTKDDKELKTDSKEIKSLQDKVERAKADLEEAERQKEKLDADYDSVKGTPAENKAAKEVAGQKTAIDNIKKVIDDLEEKLKKAKADA